jgi:hypothetical protein
MLTKNIAYGGFNIKCNCIGRGYIVSKQRHSASLRPMAAAPNQQDARGPLGHAGRFARFSRVSGLARIRFC